MIRTHRVPTHPGEVLQDEFVGPLGLTQVKLAGHIGVPVQRINEIIRGKRGITSETAWLFAQAWLAHARRAASPSFGKPADICCSRRRAGWEVPGRWGGGWSGCCGP